MTEDRFRIVVAEDEDPIRENLVRLLRLEGFDVVAGANGEEALALIREHGPGLVLSDAMMPKLDGYGLLKVIRDDPETANIPFIFLTARADRDDLRGGMNLGADDYLVKPFQREEVLAAVRARAARSAAHAQTAQKAKDEAKRLLHFDPLTDLPNQTLLLDRLRAAMNQAQRDQGRVALLTIGLDGLGRINDTLGREQGDRLLCEAADRLFLRINQWAFASEFDTVARRSGDQFSILVAGFGDDAQLDRICADVAEITARPYRLGGHDDIFMTACVGAALLGEGAETPEELLRRADAAMNQAKAAGPGNLRHFSSQMNEGMVRRVRLHNELHKALERGEVSLHYQPKIEIASLKIVGFEALMRWRHPDLGFVSPGEFIPVAEESGIIVALGAWALTEACRQTKAWLDAGHRDLRVAVNLSARQFGRDDLVETIASALHQAGLPPRALELEITESIALHGVERTLAILTSLKDLGVTLAMDDFGTGYSWLSYLKRFPIDALKIDQSFVRNITTDKGDAAIARAVVAMAHSFGMIVVAEGVETREALDVLAGFGCEDAQGYYFSKPLPAVEATALLACGPIWSPA